MDLNGRTALLTGATGGLGRAIATALAARGARLILSSRKAEELVKVARSLPGTGHTTLVSDLAEEGAALVREVGWLQPERHRPRASRQPRVARADDPRATPSLAAAPQRSLRLHLVDLRLRVHSPGFAVCG